VTVWEMELGDPCRTTRATLSPWVLVAYPWEVSTSCPVESMSGTYEST
jgi:hypothetical protein